MTNGNKRMEGLEKQEIKVEKPRIVNRDVATHTMNREDENEESNHDNVKT